MVKTYTVPFTCNQLIYSVIFFVHVLGIWSVVMLSDTSYHIGMIPITIFSWGGVIVFWVIKVICWDFEGKIPHLKCKCEEEK